MKPNPGYLPDEAKGKHVLVLLVKDGPDATPRNWPADGKAGCSWKKSGLPVDIAFYEVVK